MNYGEAKAGSFDKFFKLQGRLTAGMFFFMELGRFKLSPRLEYFQHLCHRFGSEVLKRFSDGF